MSPSFACPGCLSKQKGEERCGLNQSVESPLAAEGFILNAFSFSVQIGFISRTFNSSRFGVPRPRVSKLPRRYEGAALRSGAPRGGLQGLGLKNVLTCDLERGIHEDHSTQQGITSRIYRRSVRRLSTAFHGDSRGASSGRRRQRYKGRSRILTAASFRTPRSISPIRPRRSRNPSPRTMPAFSRSRI